MDNFVDKIAKKFNMQDMIRVNAEAEAAELHRVRARADKMQGQLDQYDQAMQEMRKLNLKNTENAQLLQDWLKEAHAIQAMDRTETLGAGEKLEKMVKECIDHIQTLQNQDDSKEKILARLEELQILFSDFKNDLVGIQRNFTDQKSELQELQRIFTDQKIELQSLNGIFTEQTGGINEINSTLAGQNAALMDLRGVLNNQNVGSEEIQKIMDGQKAELEDIIHKENVKVYRNVQAMVTEEIEKKSKPFLLGQQQAAGKNKILIILISVSTVIGLGSLSLLLLQLFGIL